MIVQFCRTDIHDGASEILTVVTDGTLYWCEALQAELPYLVQITSGPDMGDDFFGLWDLDGEEVPRNNHEWEICEQVPSEILAHIEISFATGNTTVDRVEVS